MTMPYYVAPEQVMKDRAEYAQKGIARGRSLVATTYDQGILIVADNPSRSLHKISTTSSTSCASPASATQTPRGMPTAAKTSKPDRWPTCMRSIWVRCSPTR